MKFIPSEVAKAMVPNIQSVARKKDSNSKSTLVLFINVKGSDDSNCLKCGKLRLIHINSRTRELVETVMHLLPLPTLSQLVKNYSASFAYPGLLFQLLGVSCYAIGAVPRARLQASSCLTIQ